MIIKESGSVSLSVSGVAAGVVKFTCAGMAHYSYVWRRCGAQVAALGSHLRALYASEVLLAGVQRAGELQDTLAGQEQGILLTNTTDAINFV